MPVSIDVGSKYTKILKGSYTKKGIITITSCIIDNTPKDTVENGYIKNIMPLSLFLKDIIQANGLTKNLCNITVKSSDIAAREFVVPLLGKRKLKKIVANEIASIFGTINEYYVDWFIAGTYVENCRKLCRIMVYAVPKKIVSDYFKLISHIGLKPGVFDVHRNCIYKLFSQNININRTSIIDKNMIVIDIGASYMELDLITEGNSIYKRSVPINDKFKNVNQSIRFVNDYGTLFNGTDCFSEDYIHKNQDTLKTDNLHIFSKISEETYKIMRFSLCREGGKPVTNIYLYGGNSSLDGLEHYLADSLAVSVEKIENISIIRTSLELNVSNIIAAAGCIIRKQER